jgi:succinoglycan biosynthesis protein ExoV
MRLRYAKLKHGNFGDDLNPWLWPKLWPEIFDDDNEIRFMGIGSMLSVVERHFQENQRIVVFGTGAGYAGLPEFRLGKKFPWHFETSATQLVNYPETLEVFQNPNLHVYCVRGPLTTRLLNLDEKLAITDAAVLVRKVAPLQASDATQISFMPIHRTALATDYKEICDQLSFQYIDPCEGVEQVLKKLRRTKVLISEALHGAIVADALRIPWIPVVSNPTVLRFKWEDYCLSLGMPYNPTRILPVWNYEKLVAHFGSAIPSRMRLMAKSHIWNENRKNVDHALESLLMASARPPYLSNDKSLLRAVERLEEKLEDLKNDINSGVFALGRAS